MKAILFLAVLVIAAQSNPIHELYRGFISNLPMETELKNSVMNDGLECLHQFTWVIRLVQHDLLEGKNFMEAIKEVLYIEDLLKQKVVPQCLMTSQRIWKFFQENRGNPKLYFSSESELILFEAKMMQTLGRAVEDLIYNRGFQAGEKMADFMKFGFNMIDPELPQVEPDDSYLYLFIILEEKAIRELLPSLFKELGGNEAQINGCVSCVKDLISFIKNQFLDLGI